MLDSLRKLYEEIRSCDIRVALIGQPSVGKSALFNALTGSSAKVASFPGTTVEYKVGRVRYGGKNICVVDLPGIYVFSAYTLEEVLTKLISLEIPFDRYLVLVDSTRFGRTFYLALQILELFPNTIIVLTKWDYAKKLGIEIDFEGLSKYLGIPVVPVSAVTGYGLNNLLNAVLSSTPMEKAMNRASYGDLDETLSRFAKTLDDISGGRKLRIDSFGAVLHVLEGDEEVARYLSESGYSNIVDEVRRAREGYESRGMHLDIYIARARYEYIDRVVGMFVSKTFSEPMARKNLVDRVFTNRFLGPLTGVLIVLGIFVIVFAINTGFPLNIVFKSIGLEEYAEYIESHSLSGLVGELFSYISNAVYSWIEGYSTILADFVARGIINAIGAVLTFLPLIFISFIFLSIVEDSGLGPRIAMVLHNSFKRFGLSGRAIYPFMISLGCNVPGVLASRTSIDYAERMEIIFSSPFVLCQARLIVLLALVSALFPGDVVRQIVVLISLYLGSIALYLMTAKIIRMFVVREMSSPELLLELPPIHLPSAKTVWWDSIDLVKHFVRKAGTIIFGLGIAMWILQSYGPSGHVSSVSQSFASYIGRAISPLFTLYGIGPQHSWVLGLAFFAGFIAKEGILAMLNQIYGELSLTKLGITVTQGLAFIFLFMYYMPCLATLATIHKEVRDTRLTLFSLLYSLIIAFTLSYIVYIALSIV